MPTRHLLLLLALLLTSATAASAQATLERVFPNLPPSEDSWHTALRTAGNGDNRFYVVEQIGRIRSFVRDSSVSEAPVFLDITDRVFYDDLPEPGLLGLAFHPDYYLNGYFYVTYVTEDGDGLYRWRLSRFSVIPGALPPAADPASEVILLDIERTDWHHNGGDLHFGPDGYLYVTLGDGHCCNDPDEQGQDRTTLLGSLLRLDVDNPDPGLHYGIPPDNPFVGNTEGWREEIYAYGFRNPWRFSIDPVTGQIWLGDVGEVTWEEVNLIEAGGNYGWDDMEGPDCHEEPDCDPSDYIAPIWYYDHTVGVAVIGGYVYRGAAIPELYGQYIFSEWALRKLWALSYDPDSGEPPVVTLLEEDLGVTPAGYALDEDGEIYAVNTFESGNIFKLTPTNPSPTEPPPPMPEEPALELRPNPAATILHLSWQPAPSPADAPTEVSVYDVLGRRVLSAPLSPGRAETSLDIVGLRPGTYVARVGTRSQTFTVVR